MTAKGKGKEKVDYVIVSWSHGLLSPSFLPIHGPKPCFYLAHIDTSLGPQIRGTYSWPSPFIK